MIVMKTYIQIITNYVSLEKLPMFMYVPFLIEGTEFIYDTLL